MALRIVEFFGYAPLDPAAQDWITALRCPFTNAECSKKKLGACSVEQTSGGPVIICPNRFYAQDHKILTDIAIEAFGAGVSLTRAAEIERRRSEG